MKNIELSPFVYLIKGRIKWAFYDLLNEKIIQVIPEGEVSEFIEEGKRRGLFLETEGIFPFKFNLSLDEYEKEIRIREFQIRVTGECEESCKRCSEYCGCYRGGGEMSNEVKRRIINQIEIIKPVKILISGGNPYNEIKFIEE